MKPILITTMFRNGYFLKLPRNWCLLIQKRKFNGRWGFGIERTSRFEFYILLGKPKIFFRFQDSTEFWDKIDKDRIIIGRK